MLISEKDAIEGARVLTKLGKIKAATAWHAVGYIPVSNNWRERVLQELVRRAEDIDADAIIGVDYEVEPVVANDEGRHRIGAHLRHRHRGPARQRGVGSHISVFGYEKAGAVRLGLSRLGSAHAPCATAAAGRRRSDPIPAGAPA